MQVPHSLLTCYTCSKTFRSVRGLGYHKTHCYGKKRAWQPASNNAEEEERHAPVDDLGHLMWEGGDDGLPDWDDEVENDFEEEEDEDTNLSNANVVSD